MEKLTYKEYKGNKNILTIDLHNDYTVIAIKTFNKDKNIYTVDFMLKENTVSKWDVIEKTQDIEFDATSKSINSAILKQVATFLNEGFFDYYIQRYEYEMKCFDVGNDLAESDRLANNISGGVA